MENHSEYQLAQLQRLVIAPHQFRDRLILLTSEQAHYLCRVLRLQQGDRFVAMDGQGQSWVAKLLEQPSHPLEAEILERVNTKTDLPVTVTLIMALPKGSGFDEVVRQATELGVTCIAPLISDRTLLNPSPQKLDRWRRIAQEAAEQSERQIVPTILEPVSFAEHLQAEKVSLSARYFCVTRQSAPHLLTRLMTDCERVQSQAITLAIGPEGGWTDAEIDQAIAAGYHPVSLGSRIFRAVTAPIVALALVAARFETASDNGEF